MTLKVRWCFDLVVWLQKKFDEIFKRVPIQINMLTAIWLVIGLPDLAFATAVSAL